MSSTKKLSISAIVIAIYVAIVYATASIAFGQYQIRFATALYALSYQFPFLVVPLGVANSMANFLSGQVLDGLGGFFAGVATAYLIYLIRKLKLPKFLVFLPILIVPTLLVPIWLQYILGVNYFVLVVSLFMGQIVPSLLGIGVLKIWKE